MVTITHFQKSFSGGVVSPHIAQSRSDLKEFRSFLSECTNYIPLVDGSLIRRPKTGFFAKAYNQDSKRRYIICATQEGSIFYCEFSHKVVDVYQAIDDTSAKHIAVSESPYTSDEVEDLRFSPNIIGEVGSKTMEYSGDKAGWCVTHPNHPPQIFGRIEDSWFVLPMAIEDGAYLDEFELSPGEYRKNAKLHVVKTGDVKQIHCPTELDFFHPNDVGRHIRLCWEKEENTLKKKMWLWGIITKFTNAQNVDVDFPSQDENFINSIISQQVFGWRMGAWSKGLGYPSFSVLFQDRLVFSGSPREKDTLYFSKPYNEKNKFSPTISGEFKEKDLIDSTASFKVKLASDTPQQIRWLSTMRDVLLIGTDKGEWELSSKEGRKLTLRQISYYGGSGEVIKCQQYIVFLQRSFRSLILISHKEREGYSFIDLSTSVDHFLKKGIKEIAYQQSPYSIIWVVMKDGGLGGITFDGNNGIKAWHFHKLGGVKGVKVEGVVVSPSLSRMWDMVWLLTDREGELFPKGVELLRFDLFDDFDSRDYGCKGSWYPYVSQAVLPPIEDALTDPRLAGARRRIATSFIDAVEAKGLECGVVGGGLSKSSEFDKLSSGLQEFYFSKSEDRKGEIIFRQGEKSRGRIGAVAIRIEVV